MSLYKLYNDIKNVYKYEKFTVNKYNGKLHKTLKNNKFFGKLDLRDYKNIYYIDIDNNKIWFITNKERLDQKLTNKIINRILSFKKYSQNTYENNIYLWLTDYKKRLPLKKGEILSVENVNSGCSIIYHPMITKNGDIEIWRKEEIYKVLMHELLHSLRYDYYSQNDELDQLVKQKFNVDNHIKINESYTETLATILNCIYFSLENNQDYNYFLGLLANEQNYSKNQTIKILQHYGYHNIHDLYRKNSYKNKIFPQKTAVFSYYILKTMLLNDLKNFCKFALDNKNKLKFPKNGNKNYYKLLIKSYNKCIFFYNDFNNNHNKSLRMTIT